MEARGDKGPTKKKSARRQIRPRQFDVNLRLELEDPAGAPQWVKTFVFQQMAIRRR